LLVGRYPPACCSSRLPVLLLRLLQKVNGAQCQQLPLAVLLAWLEPSYHPRRANGPLLPVCFPPCFYDRGTPSALTKQLGLAVPLSSFDASRIGPLQNSTKVRLYPVARLDNGTGPAQKLPPVAPSTLQPNLK
jgi:hypothetical protein